MPSLASDGYAVLPGLLQPDQVRSVRAAVNRLLAAALGLSCERPNNTLVPLRWDDEIVATVVGDGTRLARATGAQDLRWISGYVSIKDPQSPPLWWHQDWWCWDHPISLQRAPVQVAVLCYLTDTSVTNGALRVLPGSHVRSRSLHAVLPEAHSEESIGMDLGHPAMMDQPDQVTLGVRAGDAVITDYRLLHGTHGNGSADRRDCVLLSFTPSWRDLPTEIRAHLIQHPALPAHDEEVPVDTWATRLLPVDGVPPADLELSRNAPPVFAVR